ncbi:Leukocyte elastase inhibitor [Paragonimus heterotremus]|uniref:Leukocyte elastase inhibitor n=1 Tax=Paragonimus heterotremus TaxID=100268 RepID=A0A8J4X3P8_9TREM|nr:Leukocyte elastase inhibitor [Paragonimus heterotremus]
MASAEAIQHSICQFAANLYDKIISQQQGDLHNVLISPLSIYTALAMTMAGADGKTKDELERVLHVNIHMDYNQQHKVIGSTVTQCLNPNEGAQLVLANRLFLLQPVTIVKEFSEILSKHYKANIELVASLSGADPKRQYINQWTSKHTEQKINELLPSGSVNCETILTLVNALYFKGQWGCEFDKELIFPSKFACYWGKTMEIQMMFKESEFPYVTLKDWDAQAIYLPFRGADLKLLIVLPSKLNGLPSLLDNIRKPGALTKLLTKPFIKTELELSLPRFKLAECKPIDLKTLLIKCGVTALFASGDADLSKLCCSRKIHVSDIFHKALLEVDEGGVTAAAATAEMVVEECAYECPTFRVDHSFFIALMWASTIPVLMGHVTAPENI